MTGARSTLLRAFILVAAAMVLFPPYHHTSSRLPDGRWTEKPLGGLIWEQWKPRERTWKTLPNSEPQTYIEQRTRGWTFVGAIPERSRDLRKLGLQFFVVTVVFVAAFALAPRKRSSNKRSDAQHSPGPSEAARFEPPRHDPNSGGQTDTERAVAAFHVLNHLLSDLLVASRIRDLFFEGLNPPPPPMILAGVNRVCLSTLFLALCKWAEFYDAFHDLIPDAYRKGARDLRDVVKKRRIVDFRNRFVGHILDKRKGRPLTLGEIDESVEAIVRGDQDAFVRWCNDRNPVANLYPDTVVGIIETIRDGIRDGYGLTMGDLERG
jgi:hypothetical protein